MHNNRPDMSGDLFPWKFDLEDELAEIFANHPDTQRFLLGLRGLYALLFALVAGGLSVLLAYEGAHTGTELWILALVSVWMVWKLVNEIRFFFGYYSHGKMCQWAQHTLWLKEGRK